MLLGTAARGFPLGPVDPVLNCGYLPVTIGHCSELFSRLPCRHGLLLHAAWWASGATARSCRGCFLLLFVLV